MNTPTKALVRYTVVLVLCVDWEQRTVLLVEQERPNGELGWTLPGGTWEINESAEEAAVRELKEETGLDVHLVRLYDSFVDVVEYEESRVAVFILVYEASCHGELQPQDPDAQVHRAAWIPLDLLEQLPFLHERQREVIRRYVETHLQYGLGLFNVPVSDRDDPARG